MATSTVELSEREQWLAKRKQFIGGSDSAAMFNEGYGCTRRLVYDKGGAPADFPRTPSEKETLQRGQDLEEMTAFKFQQETELDIRKMPTRISKVEPRAGVNVDRQIIGVSEMRLAEYFPDEFKAGYKFGPTGVLECKTANEFVFKQILKDGVPPHYVLQMQHSLAVTGYKWGIFAVLGYGPSLWRVIWFPMLRDEALCNEILARTPQVWSMIEQFQSTGEMIPAQLKQPDKRCKNCEWRKTCLGTALALAVPDEDKDIPEDDSLAELASDYIVAKQAYVEAEELVETIVNQLKERIGSNPGAIVPAAGIGFSFKTGKPPMRLDQKALDGVLGVIEAELPKENTEDYAEQEISSPWFQVVVNLVKSVRGCKRPGAPSRPFKPFEL